MGRGACFGSNERRGTAGSFPFLDEGVSCSSPALQQNRSGARPAQSPLAPPIRHIPPPGNKAERPVHSGCVGILFIYLFFFEASIGRVGGWGRGGWGGISILGLQNPALLIPTPFFPLAKMDRWRSFPNSQLRGRREGSRAPAGWWGERRKCASHPWLGESSAAGQDRFPGSYPGSGCLFSNPGEASGGNGRTGLICNEFCPLALGEKIFIA